MNALAAKLLVICLAVPLLIAAAACVVLATREGACTWRRAKPRKA